MPNRPDARRKTGLTSLMAAAAAALSWTAQAAPAPSSAAPPATAAAPTAPAPAPYVDPPVPGVCVLSREALVADTLVGHSVATRLEQLKQQVDAGLLANKRTLDNAEKALQAEQSTLPQIQVEAKARALGQRRQAFQELVTQKEQQFDATRTKALRRIVEEAQPVVEAAYESHRCGVLIDGAAVIRGGAGLDITAAVRQGLDAKINTLTVNLEPAPSEPRN